MYIVLKEATSPKRRHSRIGFEATILNFCRWISVLSSSAVILCAVLTWVCMFWDNTTAFSYRDVPPVNWQSVAIAYGILAFQVACHPAILAIQADMKNKKDLSQSVLCSFFSMYLPLLVPQNSTILKI